MRLFCLYGIFAFAFGSQMMAQEINAKVVIDYRQIQGTNVSVFQTLETALTEFVNNNNWTDNEYQPNERIECNFFISLSSSSDNTYSGSVTITARRPIYNASISTTMLNLVDDDFTFTYNEFDQLIFNKNSLTQDLTAVFGYYIYIILGVDADSFKEFGGNSYFNEAVSIVNTAKSSNNLNESGWDRLGSERNRGVLISEMMASEFRPLRSYIYKYHRQGLDVMTDDVDKGAEVILSGLSSLEKVADKNPSSYAMQIFFDVKSDELQSIVKEMNTDDEEAVQRKKDIINLLKKLDPGRLQAYDKLSQ